MSLPTPHADPRRNDAAIAALSAAVSSGRWSALSGTARGVYVALLVSARLQGSALVADADHDRLSVAAQASRPSVYRALAAIEAAGLGRRDSTAPNIVDLTVDGASRRERSPVLAQIGGDPPDPVSPVRRPSHPRDTRLTHETNRLTGETPRAESKTERQKEKSSSSSSSSSELRTEWEAAERSLRDRLGFSRSDAARVVDAAIRASREPGIVADAIDTIEHRRKSGTKVYAPARYVLAFVANGYSLPDDVLAERRRKARELVTTNAPVVPPGPTSDYAARVWAEFSRLLGEAWEPFTGRVAMHVQDGALRILASEMTADELRGVPGIHAACNEVRLACRLREIVVDVREVRP